MRKFIIIIAMCLGSQAIAQQLPEELQGLGIELDHVNETKLGLNECYEFYGHIDSIYAIYDIVADMSIIGAPLLFETDDEEVFEFERPGLRGIMSLNKNFDRLAIIFTRHPEEVNESI